MNDPMLRLSDIKKSYNAGQATEITVLDGANLTVDRGEIVALVAPSGAGKSTLLHIAGLLDTADSGAVEIAGQPLQRASDAERTRMRRRSVGFVYQFHHLLPEFTARENIVLPQLANGVPNVQAAARADNLLDKVALAKRAGHRPAEMSGGEQQRVAFCRALANNPGLLLADEPTGNLDPGTSDTVFAALMGLVRETGLSAVIATHNLELAARMDRQVRLDAGKIVALDE
ncbi:ABC transporter ATP-binding protein [Thalassobacter stenotrophicus]|uniref:Lipoprotein-releasing system ATP-binding protein LolD n=2 Tax=Thalassobacter stenotrophicus TaxID=266809 RepID=A0A0P1FNR1_9RHOB|nr:ABC transporter ATP-binding protein [Thalassobacter stenotrophicus]PVZ48743.1 ABC transporter ATP-binding protein [Thalassobacter stenotrophicus]CUH62300.1 Lipoprotein-releasing system ATP-binding protein LolD [Thalassobacter stenotrophicus]SHI30781.1 lipoprotein-releasing system ATP-binding protein [Thalassobacter stenotrophicus DSM 16310]